MPVNTEALARGLGQGVTFGFMDELAAAMQAYKNANKPKPDVQGFDIQYNPWTQMEADYKNVRDAWRQRDKELAQEAPGEYMLGNMAGGLPIGMAANSIPQNLALGAAYGLGGSEGSKEKQVKDLTKEALISGGLTAANPWLGMAGTIIKFPSKQSQNIARQLNNEKIAKKQIRRDLLNYGYDKLNEFKDKYFKSNYRSDWYSNLYKEGNKTLEDSFNWNKRDLNKFFKDDMLNMENFYKNKLDNKEISDNDFRHIKLWIKNIIKD